MAGKKKSNFKLVITTTVAYAVIIAAAVVWITIGDIPTWSSGEGDFEKAQHTGTFANLDAELGVVGGVGITVTDEKLPTIADANGEKRGAVFVLGNKGLELFQGSITSGQNYANVINQYAQKLPADTTIYNMVVPSHCEFAMPEKYRNLIANQNERISSICKAVDPRVKAINIYPNMRRHLDEYIYFNTDHHWTGRGAFYAYQYFALYAGFPSLELSAFEEKSLPNTFLGSLYNSTLDTNMASNPDTLYYYNPPGNYTLRIFGTDGVSRDTTLFNDKVSGTSSYLAFIHGDNPLSVIYNNNEKKTGRKIIMTKESYGNAFAPYLAYHYDEVHIVDQRTFNQNIGKYMEKNGIKEILIMNNIFAAHTGVRMSEVEALINK